MLFMMSVPARFDPGCFREWFLMCEAGFFSRSWCFLSPCCSSTGDFVALVRVSSPSSPSRMSAFDVVFFSAPGLFLFIFICIVILCQRYGMVPVKGCIVVRHSRFVPILFSRLCGVDWNG
jgi:hypothetical protein